MMTHIGDGVYADFDGYQLKLCANSPTAPTDTIFLDPYVMEGLIRYYKKCMADMEKPEDKDV